MMVCPFFTVSPTFTLISRITPGNGDLTPDLPVEVAAGFTTVAGAGAGLVDTITILLGLTVGASTQASEFLTIDSILIFALGALSFIIATASGVIFVKIFNLVLGKDNKINPLIGNAGVSAVPDSARISQVIGLEYDPTNYLLMHAMGPNVAGVIGSAVAAGILLGFLM